MNRWQIAARDSEVGRWVIMRIIAGQPVVLYRRQDGVAVALSGLCPHRAFPLGTSCLRGDDIECAYHGMSFGPDGRCRGVPWREEAPQSYQLTCYPLTRQGEWLTIWMGDPALVPAATSQDTS